jgi:hypothetical protein
MFEQSVESRLRSYSEDFFLPDITMAELNYCEYDTQQAIPEDRWSGYNEFSQVEIPPPPPQEDLRNHPDAWMLSVTEADWARITESLAEEQRFQKMDGVSLLLPISNSTNAKKRNAALHFVDEVFSSRNLRRKTHNVRGAWESSERALHSEIDAILHFIQENSKKSSP